MKYFAYGSNMLLERLRHRVPSARPIGVARLIGHTLAWHKRGRDGSGKCDIPHIDDPSVSVWGVVYEIDPVDKPGLDRAEGLGQGYNQKDVTVDLDGEGVMAFTYFATDIDESLVSYHWYKAFVLEGAKQNGLPQDYIRVLESVRSVQDPDSDRRKREDSILRAGR